jgi:hypothetical protein
MANQLFMDLRDLSKMPAKQFVMEMFVAVLMIQDYLHQFEKFTVTRSCREKIERKTKQMADENVRIFLNSTSSSGQNPHVKRSFEILMSHCR